jgi:4'-phosphopantetheinyl transferase
MALRAAKGQGAIDGGCEVWIAGIPEFAAHSAALTDVLSPEERAHVDGLGGGRATATLSRALLRLVLSRYLDLPPTEIEIDRSCSECGRSHGRPRLPARRGTTGGAIEFSVSHGGDLLVLAFAGRGPVGVDVEPIEGPEDVPADLVDFTLTAAERLRLREGPAAQRRRIFLRHWTGKEAILKALGTGLDVDLQAVTLPPFPDDSKASVTVPGSPPVELWVTEVDVGPAHICTLATGETVRNVRPSRLSPRIIHDHWSG